MSVLADVILPVFLIIGCGYLAAAQGVLSSAAIDHLMSFAVRIAIPCLLFRAVATSDLNAFANPALLGGYYLGAGVTFVVGYSGARFLFSRSPEDAVVVGFTCLFANSVLLGLAIAGRAYGMDALTPNYTIVALHAPFCYLVGITAMELTRAQNGAAAAQARKVVAALFTNALIIGIVAGALVNLAQLPVPQLLADALDMMVDTALPLALFALGGVLMRYRLTAELPLIAFAGFASMALHPFLVLQLGQTLAMPPGDLRAAVLTAAMPPGMNSFLFAALYGRAKGFAATTVLVTTPLSILTVWGWLALLG